MCSTGLESRSRLCELPDELLLQILENLTIVRGYYLKPELETARRAESARRLAAIHGLTLACRRLNNLSTSFLYESVTRLEVHWCTAPLFLRTIAEKPKLMDHVRYIEAQGQEAKETGLTYEMYTSLSCALKTTLSRISRDEHWSSRITSTGVKLSGDPVAVLVTLAQNLDIIVTKDLGYYVMSWEVFRKPENYPELRQITIVPTEGIKIDFHISPSAIVEYSPETPPFELKRKIGLLWNPDYDTFQVQRYGDVASLRSMALDICGNFAYTFAISGILLLCTSLRRFQCRWSTLHQNYTTLWIEFREVQERLECFKHCLEILVLEMDSGCQLEEDEEPALFANLHEYTALTHLEISGSILWDGYDRVEHAPVSWNLPPRLETFIVHVEWDDFVEKTLAGLSGDCVSRLPNLKSVDCSSHPAPRATAEALIAKFKAVGVDLKLAIAESIQAG